MATKEELILKVEADTKQALQNLKVIEQKGKELNNEEVVIGVKVASDTVERESKAILNRLHALEKGIDIPIDVDTASLNTMNSALDDIGRRGGAGMQNVAKGTQDAGQAMSVFANFTGNAAQEIPGISGAFGPLNMAISQFVEYTTEGSISMASLAASAGPMLIMAAAIGAATLVIQRFKQGAADAAAQAKDVAEEVVGMTKALQDAREAGTGAAESLTDLAKTEIVDILTKAGAKAPQVVSALNKLGITADDLVGSFDGSNTKLQDAISLLDEYQSALESVIPAGGDVNDAVALLAATHGVSAKEMKANIDAAYLLDGALTKEQKSTIAAATAARTLDGYLGDSTISAKDNAKAAKELADAQKEANAAFDTGAEVAGAYGDVLDGLNADSALNFSEMASNTVQSFDDIKAALKETQDLGKRPLVPTTVQDLKGLTDEQAKVIDSIGGMRDAIQTELQAALSSAGGDFTALKDKAAFFRGEIQDQFPAAFQAMGLNAEQAQAKTDELIAALGILPSDVETQIRLTQQEEAMRKLEIFGSAIDQLPPEVQTQVLALADSGDAVGAWNLLNSTIQSQGAAKVSVEADEAAAKTSANAAADAFEKRAADSTATIPVDADTTTADTKTKGWQNQQRKTTVDVQANLSPASASINSLNGRDVTVDVRGVWRGFKAGAGPPPGSSTTTPTGQSLPPPGPGAQAMALEVTPAGMVGPAATSFAMPLAVQAAAPITTNVTIQLPPGSDSDSRVVGAVQRWAKRNGKTVFR